MKRPTNKRASTVARLERKFDFSLSTATVRVPSGGTALVQLYAAGVRAVFAYRLAYFPESLLGEMSVADKAIAMALLEQERIALANGNKRRLPGDGSFEADARQSKAQEAEQKFLMELCNAHRARQAILGSAIRLSPPSGEAETVDLYAKIAAESLMAAYVYQYAVCKYYDIPGVNWDVPVFVNVKNFDADPKLPEGIDWPTSSASLVAGNVVPSAAGNVVPSAAGNGESE